MSFRRWLPLLALLALPAIATAQSVAGTWTTPAPRGPVVLTLRVSGSTVSGTLVGNGVTMNVKGTAEADEAFGTIESGTGTAIFTAHLDGGRLMLALTENGADGRPNAATARELIFTRTAAGATGTVATAPAAGAARAGGNPLAGGRAAADPLEGTFVSDVLTAVVRRSASGYAGVLSLNGTDYPFTATANGPQLSGTFAVEGQRYPFESRLAGDAMTLSSGGRDYPMTRKVDAAAGAARSGGSARGAGAAAPAAARAPAGGGIGLAGATGVQERQIAELLVSSAWCTMSYSGGTTYTGGSYGRTTTERVVFAADGQGMVTTGGENSNSGAPGSVVSQSSGGQRFMWKIQGMNLVLSQDGVQWAPTPLQIYDNGSGAPIVKSEGKEYNRCR